MASHTPEELDIADRRHGELVRGAFSMMLVRRLFTIEEVRERSERGVGTPLDLMPFEFWSPPSMEHGRFTEENLGEAF